MICPRAAVRHEVQALTTLTNLPDGPVPEHEVLAGYPAPRVVPPGELASAVASSGRYLAVLDDDPTGTQSVADVPVLTAWDVDDIRWALQQSRRAFYILTNTRSLGVGAMTARNQSVAASLVCAAKEEGAEFVVASRSDSTLRGHYPAEVEVLSAALVTGGRPRADGVVFAPAYIEAGRLTVGSVHWAGGPDGFLPVGHSEFARDATFGYRSSDLRDYVEEKTGGRWAAADVERITLHEVRAGGPETVAAVLMRLRGGRPVVVDAACDNDLRVVVLGVLAAEAAGARLIYRVGPSFVRSRAGLVASPPLTPTQIASLTQSPAGENRGLVVVGSHVPRTARQLEALCRLSNIERVELDVSEVLDPLARDGALARAADRTVDALPGRDVVLATSRQLVTGAGPEASLAIAQAVSSALVHVVRSVLSRAGPSWLVAKGGITSSDLATEAVGFRRAWARGSLLPGIISLWLPLDGSFRGRPYVVFAGNVGDDDALATVVSKLRGGS